jgi:hypothetical protein
VDSAFVAEVDRLKKLNTYIGDNAAKKMVEDSRSSRRMFVSVPYLSVSVNRTESFH